MDEASTMHSNSPTTALLALLLVGCAGTSTEATPKLQVRATATSPTDDLNALDPRKPVPLQSMMAWHQKQNMQEHLVAIQRITEGLAREDWEAVSAAASTIALSPQMQMQCEHMRAGADGFTEAALEFHHRADAIAKATEGRDVAAALAATA